MRSTETCRGKSERAWELRDLDGGSIGRTRILLYFFCPSFGTVKDAETQHMTRPKCLMEDRPSSLSPYMNVASGLGKCSACYPLASTWRWICHWPFCILYVTLTNARREVYKIRLAISVAFMDIYVALSIVGAESEPIRRQGMTPDNT